MNIKPNPLVVVLFIGLAFSTYLRLDNLNWETFGYSEVETWQAANEYLKGNFVHDIYTFDTPPLRRYFVALSMFALGTSEFSFRIISVTAGIILVIMTFLIGRRLYDEETGVLASCITAFSVIHLQFSRYLTDDLFFSIFYIAGLFFFWSYIETGKKNYSLLTGVCIGLAAASRFMAIFLIITLAVYSIVSKKITFRLKPNFTATIDNNLLKAIAVSIIVFFLIWPFSLVSLRTDIAVNVPSLDTAPNQFSKDIPLFMLSMGKRISNSGVTPPEGLFKIPVFSYLLSFISKENILITLLLFTGVFAISKAPLPVDKFVLFAASLFFIMLWLQNWGFSYRYVSIIIPLIAFVSARSVSLIADRNTKHIIIAATTVVLLLYAFSAHPNYALSFSPVNSVFSIPPYESWYSEGMKESSMFLKENCDEALVDSVFYFNTLPYGTGFFTNNQSKVSLPVCVLKSTSGYSDNGETKRFIDAHSCELIHTTKKSGIPLQEIFICS